MFFYKVELKFVQWFWVEDFQMLKMAIYLNYFAIIPIAEKHGSSFEQLEFPLPNDALYKVWFK